LNFLAGHNLARAFEQADEDTKRLRLEPDANAGPAQFAGLTLRLEKAEGESGRHFFLMLDWGGHGFLVSGTLLCTSVDGPGSMHFGHLVTVEVRPYALEFRVFGC
jgi:hypothetical protein